MSTENLPIFKAAYDLLLKVNLYRKNFPKEYKSTLGEQVHQSCLSTITFIYRANLARDDRKIYLDKVSHYINEVNILIRLCKDLKLFSLTQYSDLLEFVISIEKQVFGWSKVN